MKQICVVGIILIVAFNFSSCSTDEESGPPKKEIVGVVKDVNEKVYPNTKIKLSSSAGEIQTTTNTLGKYKFDITSDGVYEVSIVPPLSTTVISESVVTEEFTTIESKTVDFLIESQSLNATLVFDANDIFGEVRNETGAVPSGSQELIYARNFFDQPIGRLTPIKAPDGHQLILLEWKRMQGTVTVDCNGDLATVNISLNGLIPNGTYSFWLNFLNKKKIPGESLSFTDDVVKTEPLGSGALNVVVADNNGYIKTKINHTSCILTREIALVMAVDYHLNGKTFGSDHIPDDEDVNHALIYFQD